MRKSLGILKMNNHFAEVIKYDGKTKNFNCGRFRNESRSFG